VIERGREGCDGGEKGGRMGLEEWHSHNQERERRKGRHERIRKVKEQS
jgi:hypothetical protein